MAEYSKNEEIFHQKNQFPALGEHIAGSVSVNLFIRDKIIFSFAKNRRECQTNAFIYYYCTIIADTNPLIRYCDR